jgi:hypothetical protein
MNIEDRLKLYKKHRAEVEVTLHRISVWEDMITKGDFSVFEYSEASTLGMPRAPGFKINSPIETEVCRKEISMETVREWIADDWSRIRLKKLECEQIEIAMIGLKEQQKYILECKYFEGWSWKNIEINFNAHFANKREYIYHEAIKKINLESIKLIEEVLEQFYIQCKIA